MSSKSSIIAVHAGAGFHSLRKEAEYKKACSKACQRAMRTLKTGGSALDAVTIAVQTLEDLGCTNAGVGSSLTLEGTVECDASVMDGQSLTFGGVGAISNVKNPVSVAKKLVEEQSKGCLSLGRVPPCCMVGAGATAWAKKHGLPTVSHDDMASDSSKKTYEDHKRRLEQAETRRQNKRAKYLHLNLEENHEEGGAVKKDLVTDTVGAICVDHHGNTAAGVSSGGVSLKQPGRIGPAACYGAGCWAANCGIVGKPGVAIATSGTGEHLMRTLLARECADSLQSQDDTMAAIQHVFQQRFLGSPYLRNMEEKYGGLLALKLDPSDTDGTFCELVWGHTTDSMCVGYMTSDSKPKTFLSRMAADKRPGKTFVVEGHHCRL